MDDKAIERILKELIEEKSFIKLLRDLEREESIYTEKHINIEGRRIDTTRAKLNQFFN